MKVGHHRRAAPPAADGPRSGERGASLVEYALLVALIAVVCIVSVTFLGNSASGKISGAGVAIDNTTTTVDPGAWCTDQGWHWEQQGVATVCVP